MSQCQVSLKGTYSPLTETNQQVDSITKDDIVQVRLVAIAVPSSPPTLSGASAMKPGIPTCTCLAIAGVLCSLHEVCLCNASPHALCPLSEVPLYSVYI